MRSEIKKRSPLTFRKLMTVLAFVVAGCFLTAFSAQYQARFYFEPGSANPGDFKPPIINVKSTKDPAVYDTVDVKQGSESDLKFSIRLRGQCPEKHRLEYGEIAVGEGAGRAKIRFPVDKNHRSIGPDHGDGWDYFSFVIPFRRPDIGRSPVDVCNTELERAGNQRTKLLQEGFDIDFARAYKTELSVQCHKDAVGFYEDPSPYGGPGYLPAVIKCLPTGFKPPRTKVPDPPIEALSVLAEPAEVQGRQCPVSVTFRGKITPGQESAYATFNTKYRFVGENNFKTDWLPVSVRRGETKTVIWRRSIEEPENDRTGSLKTPGGRVKIPVYRGWMLIEVMLPNGTKRSERTDFSVDCNVQPRIRSTQ